MWKNHNRLSVVQFNHMFVVHRTIFPKEGIKFNCNRHETNMSLIIYCILYITFTSIAVIGLSLTTHDYIFLITQVYTHYETSCVFFVKSGHSDNMQMSTMIHTWSRELSRQGILSISISFTDLARDNKKYIPISKPLFVILLSTWENFEEFSKVSNELEVSLFVWFVLFMETPGNPMEEFCKNPIGNFFNLNFDTEMLILCYNETILKEWYSIRGNNTRTSNFATWKPGNYFSIFSNESLYSRRSNLFGTVLRIGTVKESSFIGTNNNKLTKLLGEIVMELSKTINFTIKVLKPVDAYGSWIKENKTWNGVIGQLVSGEIDLGVAEFTVTSNRMEAVDFTLPFLLSRNRLYMKENTDSFIHWSAYFKTFSLGIWAIIILVIATMPILLTIIKTKSSNISGSVLLENYIHVWGIYCQQGLSEFPTDSSLRLAFISIFVSAIIVSAAYSASLISFLTVTTDSLPFSTLDDFANDGSYSLIVFGNSADYDLFANSKDEVIIQMMSLMKPKKELPTGLTEAFRQVCTEKVAFYATEEVKKAINLYLSCEVNFIETGRSDSLAMTVPKGSPFKGVINYHLQKFIDNGIMNRLRGMFVVEVNLSKTIHTAVTLWDIVPILTLLFGGTILGIIILIIERFYHICKIKNEFTKSNLTKLQDELNKIRLKRLDKNFYFDKLNKARNVNEHKSSVGYFP